MSIKRKATREYDNETFAESGKRLYRDPEIADVYFVIDCGNGSFKRIPAHKNLLAVASDVFKAMFYGPLKEEGDVHVDDVTVADFEEFLQFFYIGRVKLTTSNVAGVIYLGHKYNVVECFDRCIQFVKDTLADDNVCAGLKLAIYYDQIELKGMCEKRISVNSDAVFESVSFLECDRQALKHILSIDLLSSTETKVFEAVMSWVKRASQQNVLNKEVVQAYLGASFYDIRFASMEVEEFAALTEVYGSLFSADECIEIIQMITLPDAQPKRFTKRLRQVDWKEDDVITCDRCASASPTFSLNDAAPLGSIETTLFSTNEPILLGKFECAWLCVFRSGQNYDLSSNLPVDVQIVEASDSNKIDTSISKILCNQKAFLFPMTYSQVSLDKPIIIRPGYFYEIRLTLYPEGHCFFKRKLKTDVQIDSDINIRFHRDRTGSPGRTPIGLINSLDFIRI